MRFTFAAASLLGCLLSSGICAAKPISARRDLSSISGEITARSAAELITPVRRGLPRAQKNVASKVAVVKVKWLEGKDRVSTGNPGDIHEVVKAAQKAKIIPSGTVEFPKMMFMNSVKIGRESVICFTVTITRGDKEHELWGYVPIGKGPQTGEPMLFEGEEIVVPDLSSKERGEALPFTKALVKAFKAIHG